MSAQLVTNKAKVKPVLALDLSASQGLDTRHLPHHSAYMDHPHHLNQPFPCHLKILIYEINIVYMLLGKATWQYNINYTSKMKSHILQGHFNDLCDVDARQANCIIIAYKIFVSNLLILTICKMNL